jgi:transcriptional regulator with GAF, ATPase, and Fis domain
VVVDCGAVPAHLFEAQLFGHERGAFTDAIRTTQGSFEMAHGGTLFLDEIGELPLDLQSKLLRAVEKREVRRIGGSEPIECDVRILAASNRDLAREINRGSFRADLYYRLAVVHVVVPPLRERIEDLDLLVAAISGARHAALPADFLTWARKNPWPGNVRQLRNAVQRALSLGDYLPHRWDLELGAASPPVGAGERGGGGPAPIDVSVPFREAKQHVIDDFERRYLEALLAAYGGNVSAAARSAGIDRTSIYKAMQRVGIAPGTVGPTRE